MEIDGRMTSSRDQRDGREGEAAYFRPSRPKYQTQYERERERNYQERDGRGFSGRDGRYGSGSTKKDESSDKLQASWRDYHFDNVEELASRYDHRPPTEPDDGTPILPSVHTTQLHHIREDMMRFTNRSSNRYLGQRPSGYFMDFEYGLASSEEDQYEDENEPNDRRTQLLQRNVFSHTFVSGEQMPLIEAL